MPRSNAKTVAPTASASSPKTLVITSPAVDHVIVNALLTFVIYRLKDSCTVDTGDLKHVVLSFYSAADITDAKNAVIDAFRRHLSDCGPLLKERRGSVSRPAHEAELDDVISILQTLDDRHVDFRSTFAVVDLDRLPPTVPHVVADMQPLQQQKLTVAETHADNPAEPKTDLSIDDINNRLDEFQSAINARLDYLNTICTSFTMSNTNVNANTETVKRPLRINDRSNNIVISGVAENRDPLIWRGEIENILHHVVGHEVHISDIFRLGTYRDNKTRPVLVKLSSTWDRRLVLSGCRKLKDNSSGRVFIRPDEPLDVRRKQTMDRLKQKAEREGKSVSIDDGVLSIDDLVVFSLGDGFINNGSDRGSPQGRHR